MTPRLSNKDLAKVVRQAVKQGWRHEQAGSTHQALRSGHHRITLASSPSDRNSHLNVQRRIRHCEKGTCEHGAPAASTGTKRDRAARLAADRERNDRISKERMTMTAPIGKTITATTKPATLTTKEAADLLGVSGARILQLLKAGRLTATAKPTRGSNTHITIESIEAYEKAKKEAVKRHEARPAKPAPSKQAPPKQAPPKQATGGVALALAKLDGYAMGKDDPVLAKLIDDLRSEAGA
jgi:excisionase family DNA binding protein